MNRFAFIILIVLLLNAGQGMGQAPEFTFIPPQQVRYWVPPPEFGEVGAEWKPPPGYEKYAQPWAPPPGWEMPAESWLPPQGWEKLKEWVPPVGFE